MPHAPDLQKGGRCTSAPAVQPMDGTWTCAAGEGEYPWFKNKMMHPCSWNCCNGTKDVVIAVQFTSYFHAPVSYASAYAACTVV